MFKLTLIFLFLFGTISSLRPQKSPLKAKKHSVKSPSGNIKIEVQIAQNITYAVFVNDEAIIQPSEIAMHLADGRVLGEEEKLKSKNIRHKEAEMLRPIVAEKNAEIPEEYQELTLQFKKGFRLVFRAYDDGVAYRFETDLEGDIVVKEEMVNFHLAQTGKLFLAEEESFVTHSEQTYTLLTPEEFKEDRMGTAPLVIQCESGPRIALMEADLQDYPGMFLAGSSDPLRIVGKFAPSVLSEKHVDFVDFSGDVFPDSRNYYPDQTADYMAQTRGKRAFPWRAISISESDAELLTNQLVFKLAEPNRIEDPSWIKPGKVAWDWYNAWNLTGVDFETGVNTATYKYYIDFAAQHGLEYIILDEGWSPTTDVTTVVPEVDMEELITYGESKGVGLILWVVWKSLRDKLTESLDLYQSWGIKGIKVDFMQRDDQQMVNYYWEVAEKSAKRKLLVDFHGSYKPCGIRRTYPNVLTREGVKGAENNKWSDVITPTHNVTLPFTRMLAGPMDYTPGAMVNAHKPHFSIRFNRPMSMGTRCHQLAMYVIYESPLQMLCDNPSLYQKDPACMDFLSKVPSTWDETHAIDGKIGEYVVMARSKGNDWYLGAMTNETSRTC